MAERVVDVLEVVEVDEQDGEPISGAPRRTRACDEAVDEQDAVRQPGQRVMQGLVAKLVLELLAVADVDEDALHHGRPAVGVPADDRLVVDDPHDAPVAGDEAVLPAALLRVRSWSVDLGQDHPVAVGGVHAADPQRRIARSTPPAMYPSSSLIFGADEVPTTVLPGLGDVDDARNALDDGPVLRLRHDELVGEAPLAADDPLAVDEQQRLTRQQPMTTARVMPAASRTGWRAPSWDQADDERGVRPRGQREAAPIGRVGRAAASLMDPRGRFPRVISTCSTVHRAREFRVPRSLGRQPETTMTRKYLRRLTLPWTRAALPLRRLHEQLG